MHCWSQLLVFLWIQWRLWSQMRCVSLTDSRAQSICCTVALNYLVTFLFAFMVKPSTNTLSCQTDVITQSCLGFGMHDILVTMLVLTTRHFSIHIIPAHLLWGHLLVSAVRVSAVIVQQTVAVIFEPVLTGNVSPQQIHSMMPESQSILPQTHPIMIHV